MAFATIVFRGRIYLGSGGNQVIGKIIQVSAQENPPIGWQVSLEKQVLMSAIDRVRAVVYRSLLPPRRRRALREAMVEYASFRNDNEKRAYQLAKFNEIWSEAIRTPFYRFWAEKHGLPGDISTLEELAKFPELTKADILENFELIDFSAGRGPYIQTGGSTGAPVKIPRSSIEDADTYARAFLGKVNAGLLPGDRYAHLWGHSFLFGSGRGRAVRLAVRMAKDWFAGGVRLSAYDYSEPAVVDQSEVIKRKNPSYIIGYVSAVARVARVFAQGSETSKPVRALKAVIVTSETITTSDKRVIEEGFGVPCLVEYGCAEAGVLAHSSLQDSRLSTYWRSLIISADAAGRARITTLSPRGFPLVNYALNDRLAEIQSEASVLKFGHVEGRAQDVLSLQLAGGAKVELGARLLVHSLKVIPEVVTVQYAQVGLDTDVFVTLSRKIDVRDLTAKLIADLRTEFGEFASDRIRIRELRAPVASKSGKLTIAVSKADAEPLVVQS